MTVLSCIVTTYRTLYGIWNTIFQEEKRKTKKLNDKCMYVAHVHYKNESQRQRSHCTVLPVRASYILLVQHILNAAIFNS